MHLLVILFQTALSFAIPEPMQMPVSLLSQSRDAVIVDQEKPTFQARRRVSQIGDHITVVWDTLTSSGETLVSEKVEYINGKLVRFEFDHRQTNSKGTAFFEKGKLKLSFSENGKIQNGEEDAENNMIVKDQIVPFLQMHWEALMKGETIHFRLIVPERTETVGFKVFRDEETQYKDIPAVKIKMKASSIIIAAVVNPLYFTFSKSSGHELLTYEGRVAPKKNVNGKWKDLDALTVYQTKP